MFLKNKNTFLKIRRSKVTDYAALIPILISGLKFHSYKFDCLNFISFFLDKFLNNFYFPV